MATWMAHGPLVDFVRQLLIALPPVCPASTEFKNQNEVNHLPLELSADEVTLAAQQGGAGEGRLGEAGRTRN